MALPYSLRYAPQPEDFDTEEEYQEALDFYEGELLDREHEYHERH